jgi:hypothetical protein
MRIYESIINPSERSAMADVGSLDRTRRLAVGKA